MNQDAFLDAVREENRTALSRLGSSKSLYAETMGEMKETPVLAAAATAEQAAAETFAAWADSEPDEEAAALFREVATQEEAHYDAVLGRLGEHEPGDLPAIQDHLRDVEGTVERLGAFVGRTIAADKSKEQLVGFFIGQADPKGSQLFRDLRGDLDGQLEGATDLLAARCETEDDWERAQAAATAAIQAAYEEYTERLEGMGVNPKPVC
jgi:rubrerythrin